MNESRSLKAIGLTLARKKIIQAFVEPLTLMHSKAHELEPKKQNQALENYSR
jgi:hypothetical protein